MQNRLIVSLRSDLWKHGPRWQRANRNVPIIENRLFTQDVEYEFCLITELKVAMGLSALHKIESTFRVIIVARNDSHSITNESSRFIWPSILRGRHKGDAYTWAIDFGSSILCRNFANISTNPIWREAYG